MVANRVHEYLSFAGRHWELFVALGVVLALIVADELQRRVRGAQELEPASAVMLINRGAVVVDCRGSEDFARGHISGARHMPLEALAERSDELKRKRTKPALVVAANARDTGSAAAILRKTGFESVYGLKGGLAAWRKEHMPLEKAE